MRGFFMGDNMKLLYGIGINDADYAVRANGKWVCPFYTRWRDMLTRCYSEARHTVRPTYVNCSVVEEWKTFSNFKKWMETQDWKGKHLDKDLLFPGNKEYGPDTCVFVDRIVNNFILESNSIRGTFPIGVSFHKGSKKYVARCNNPFAKKTEHLGCFTCPEEAHKAWLIRKKEIATMIAAEQKDERIVEAIIGRYALYEI